MLEIPVTDFELSVRSRNCLKKMNIRTLGDLTRVSETAACSASKNFGETSLERDQGDHAGQGLRLGQSLEEGGRYDGPRRYRPQQQLSAEEQAVLNKPVSELNLSVRARKCMNRLGINTLGELVQRTADELLESKNFGMTSLNEVREKLRAVRPDAARRLSSADLADGRDERDDGRIRASSRVIARLTVLMSHVHLASTSCTPTAPPAAAARTRRTASSRRPSSCPSAPRRPSRA